MIRPWLPATMGAITMGVCAIVMVGSAVANIASMGRLSDTTKALIFACGYLYGQRGLIESAHLDIKKPEPTESCPEFNRNAIAHGFIEGGRAL